MKNNDQSWRKCVYCGRYVSYEDIDSGKARTRFSDEIIGEYPGEPSDETESYHIACSTKTKEAYDNRSRAVC